MARPTRSPGLVVAVAMTALLAGCGGAMEVAPTSTSPTAPSEPAATTSPTPTPGAGGFCDGQPQTFSPMSDATFAKLRTYEAGFHIDLLDPTATPGIVSPHKAAGRPPRAECGKTRLVSWELALGRITTNLPCRLPKKPKAYPADDPYDLDGPCTKIRVNALQYVVVREFFGDSHPISCPFGNCLRHNVQSMSYSYVDARTGKFAGGGSLN